MNYKYLKKKTDDWTYKSKKEISKNLTVSLKPVCHKKRIQKGHFALKVFQKNKNLRLHIKGYIMSFKLFKVKIFYKDIF